MLKITPDPPIKLEETLLRVSDLLRSASAAAYETGDQLSGQKRDLAFSVIYLVEMAHALVERSLEKIEVVT
ncbi:DUF3077 domain-containing protein [Pseudomonas capsici]|uniref:DUF6124 family protein n=1 Tax=Pseudomonas capsici TaxID=2810614 RepID=UPI0021F0B224|nr:DUF3077 domain-containing protein [Pseudomonas capsici]MCV4264782.1 DUF3077 domain-containing protein [Pseudomonas capsici]MCV4274086.1 DUF3077 domain-containing protein [Pseudomonas capsici]MCV4291272.1 DUF3077 domain-containing protein [Pseudomonas capsici]